MIKQKKDAEIYRNEKEKAKPNEINHKVLKKEGRLKRYRQSVKQLRQNRTFQNNERKFYQKNWKMTRKNTYNRMQRKNPEKCWTKI